MRILVTGSRDWEDVITILNALANEVRFDETNVLIHGGCPTGADAIASRIWKNLLLEEEVYVADWKKYGRAAGPKRNKQMVEAGADVCLAFIRNNSRGATGCAKIAEIAGIPTKRFIQ
jgi:hypothetical protein